MAGKSFPRRVFSIALGVFLDEFAHTLCYERDEPFKLDDAIELAVLLASMSDSFMPITRDYPARIALYANPDGFVGAMRFAPSLDDRRPRMDHRAAKLIEIRCRKDASILYRLKPLYYLIWALLALARIGHFSPIVRELQVLLAPFSVIRPVDVCAYVWDGHYESQSGEQR